MGVLNRLKRAGKEFGQGLEALPAATVAGAKNLPHTAVGAAHGNREDIVKLAFLGAAVAGAAGGARAATMEGEAGTPSIAARIRASFASPQESANIISARSLRPTGTYPVAPHIQQAARFERLSQAPKGLTMRGRSLLAAGERGSLRLGGIPTESEIAQAHANVPKGLALTTATKVSKVSPNDVDVAMLKTTKGAPSGRFHSNAGVEDISAQAVEDVARGKSRVAGFYEKLQSESGMLKFPQKPGSMVGRVKNRVMAGINEATGATGRAEAAQTQGKIKSITDELKRMNKNEGGFMHLGKNPSGKGNQPGGEAYEAVRRANLHATRAKLRTEIGAMKEDFSHDSPEMLKGLHEDFSSTSPETGKPTSKMVTKLIEKEQKQRRVLRSIGVNAGAQYPVQEAALGRPHKFMTEGGLSYHGELQARTYADRNFAASEISRPEAKRALAKHIAKLPIHKVHPTRLPRS